MKAKFQRIYDLAKPYYRKGRESDLPHIEWMLEHTEPIINELTLDPELFIPLVILHDVGYASTDLVNAHAKNEKIKIEHMRESARVSNQILTSLQFDVKKTRKIVDMIAVHDNWILGDNKPFKTAMELAALNDLDFIQVVGTKWLFDHFVKMFNKTPEEYLEFWLHDEKLVNRPFCCEYTKELFYMCVAERKNEINM